MGREWGRLSLKRFLSSLRHQETFSQLIKLDSRSFPKSQITYYNPVLRRRFSHPVPPHHHFRFFSLVFSYFHLDVFHAFHLSRGARGTRAYLHSGCPLANEQHVSLSFFLSFFCPRRAFCTFNHVTLSRADYRRLSSLEKVRAGIRASWGIRSPNWFQPSRPSNDQFFRRADGAVACTLEEGGEASFFFPPLFSSAPLLKGDSTPPTL